MCIDRRIDLGYGKAYIDLPRGREVFTKPLSANMEIIMGMTLYGRDVYPGENSEDIIVKREEDEEIFIIRK